MRWIAIVPVLIAAACGGSGEEKKTAAKAQSLAPGQWELTSEVTAFNKADQGPPAIDTPVGTRATESVCVTSGRPRTALFAGPGYQCRYDNYYARNGRLNVTMTCGREGLSGTIPMTADGTFEAESIEYTRDIRTSLAGDGDVQITARVTGRRTGECTPETAGDNESAGDEGQNRS
jgi:hypothetical protein